MAPAIQHSNWLCKGHSNPSIHPSKVECKTMEQKLIHLRAFINISMHCNMLNIYSTFGHDMQLNWVTFISQISSFKRSELTTVQSDPILITRTGHDMTSCASIFKINCPSSSFFTLSYATHARRWFSLSRAIELKWGQFDTWIAVVCQFNIILSFVCGHSPITSRATATALLIVRDEGIVILLLTWCCVLITDNSRRRWWWWI